MVVRSSSAPIEILARIGAARLALIATLLSMVSCGEAELIRFEQPTPDPSRPASAQMENGFAEIRSRIFVPSCVRCHAQYEGYVSVYHERAKILEVVESDRMPKSGPKLEFSLKAELRAWISAGAPEFANRPERIPPNMELEPRYASLKTLVFSPKCTACHSASGQARFLDLSSLERFISQRDRDFGGTRFLNFENPDESYLLQVIRDPVEPMPPVWSGIAPLNAEEISAVREWIRLQLPD